MDTEVPMVNHQTFYTGQITLGTQGVWPEGDVNFGPHDQTFDVVFDTGSQLLLVPSVFYVEGGFDPAYSKSYTRVSTGPGGSERQPNKKDDRYRSIIDAVQLSYVSGSVRALIGQDSLAMAGLTLPGLVFGEVVGATLVDTAAFGGILGLGPPGAKPVTLTVHDQDNTERTIGLSDISSVIKRTGRLRRNTFAFYLSNSPVTDGKLMIGGYDPTLASGPLHHFPLLDSDSDSDSDSDERAYWELPLHAIKINGEPLQLCAAAGACTAVLDTGSSVLSGDTQLIDQLLRAIDVQADCGNLHDNPTISFTFLDIQSVKRDLTLSAADYTFLDPAMDLSLLESNEHHHHQHQHQHQRQRQRHHHQHQQTAVEPDEPAHLSCAVGIVSNVAIDQSLESGGGAGAEGHQSGADASTCTTCRRPKQKHMVVLGGVFLRRFLTVFDYDRARVSMAVAKHAPPDRLRDLQRSYHALDQRYQDIQAVRAARMNEAAEAEAQGASGGAHGRVASPHGPGDDGQLLYSPQASLDKGPGKGFWRAEAEHRHRHEHGH